MLKLPKSDYQVQPEDEDDQWFCRYCRKKVIYQSPKLQETRDYNNRCPRVYFFAMRRDLNCYAFRSRIRRSGK